MWFRYQKFKKVYLGIIFVFVFVSCSEKHKSDLDLRNENKELNSKLKSAKEKENIYKDSLMVIKEELMRFNNNNKTSEASNRNYLYGIPTAPPYKYINLKITDQITDGCSLSQTNTISYIINVTKKDLDYIIIIQNKDGVRSDCYISTKCMSNSDRSWLPSILIPGNKILLKTQSCGSGGFEYAMNLRSLRR